MRGSSQSHNEQPHCRDEVDGEGPQWSSHGRLAVNSDSASTMKCSFHQRQTGPVFRNGNFAAGSTRPVKRTGMRPNSTLTTPANSDRMRKAGSHSTSHASACQPHVVGTGSSVLSSSSWTSSSLPTVDYGLSGHRCKQSSSSSRTATYSPLTSTVVPGICLPFYKLLGCLKRTHKENSCLLLDGRNHNYASISGVPLPGMLLRHSALTLGVCVMTILFIWTVSCQIRFSQGTSQPPLTSLPMTTLGLSGNRSLEWPVKRESRIHFQDARLGFQDKQPALQVRPAIAPAPQEEGSKTSPDAQKAESLEFPAEWLARNNRKALVESAELGEKWAVEVRAAMLHSWDGYSIHAWGADALKPVSLKKDEPMGLGVTLIDSLSTLWLMRLYDEFEAGAQWVEKEFIKFNRCKGYQSFFEITIRVLGGLLSAYTLSGRPGLLDVIRETGERYLAAMENGLLPPQQINLCTAQGSRYGLTSVAEIGSFQLEFRTLFFLTGDERYMRIADRVVPEIVRASANQKEGFRYLPKARITVKASGLVRFGNHLTIGASCDSYIEYLLKLWLQTGKTEVPWKALFHGAMDEVLSQLADTTLGRKRLTILYDAANYKKNTPVNRLQLAALPDNEKKDDALHQPWIPVSWHMDQFFKRRAAAKGVGRKVETSAQGESSTAQRTTNALVESDGEMGDHQEGVAAKRTSLRLSSDGQLVTDTQAGSSKANTPPSFTDAEVDEFKNLLEEALARRSGGHRPRHRMEHLSCFSGGMLQLAVSTFPKDGQGQGVLAIWEFAAKEITRTCMEMYTSTATGLAPDISYFNVTQAAENEIYIGPSSAAYILRPELVESLYLLHYYTGDPIYRQWGYRVFSAIQKHCRTAAGYASVQHVGQNPVIQIDRMESFWLAETLKYLFLLFSPQDTFNLSDWVLNTEAHPLPIWKGGMPDKLRFKAEPGTLMEKVVAPYIMH